MISNLDITFARLAIALVAVAMIANLSVSAAFLRSAHYSLAQKIAQLCFIWLLPLLGALLIGVRLAGRRNVSPVSAHAMPPPGVPSPIVKAATPQHTATRRACSQASCQPASPARAAGMC